MVIYIYTHIYLYIWISLINDDWFISSGIIPAWVYWGCNCGEYTEKRFANYRWVRLGGAGPASMGISGT